MLDKIKELFATWDSTNIELAITIGLTVESITYKDLFESLLPIVHDKIIDWYYDTSKGTHLTINNIPLYHNEISYFPIQGKTAQLNICCYWLLDIINSVFKILPRC